MAAELGYDSVTVFQNYMFSSAEVIVTRHECMAPAGRPLRACASRLDVRTWSGRHRNGSCVCNDAGAASSLTLSCSGVGGM